MAPIQPRYIHVVAAKPHQPDGAPVEVALNFVGPRWGWTILTILELEARGLCEAILRMLDSKERIEVTLDEKGQSFRRPPA